MNDTHRPSGEMRLSILRGRRDEWPSWRAASDDLGPDKCHPSARGDDVAPGDDLPAASKRACLVVRSDPPAEDSVSDSRPVGDHGPRIRDATRRFSRHFSMRSTRSAGVSGARDREARRDCITCRT
jgi:hypothetical protein